MNSHGPQAKFLEICHSGGADHLKNALLTSPESVQQRIVALAIAPSVIIPMSCVDKSSLQCYLISREAIIAF